MDCESCKAQKIKTLAVAYCAQYGFGVCERHKNTCDSTGHGTTPTPSPQITPATVGITVDLDVTAGYLMYPIGNKQAGWHAWFSDKPNSDLYGSGPSAEAAVQDLQNKVMAADPRLHVEVIQELSAPTILTSRRGIV
jgi:hypothetical protein